MRRGLCSVWFLLIAGLRIVAIRGTQLPVQTSPDEIVLPLEMVAGGPATLAVLSRDGRVVAGVKLVLSDGEGVTTDESGRAHFLGLPDAGILIARIPGTEIRAAAAVMRQTGAEKLEIARAPAIVASKDRFTIDGNGFYGDADRNRVELNGKPALVLAASPKELVILASSKTAPGSTPLTVKTGVSHVSTEITIVNLLRDTIRRSLRPGKIGQLVLHVSGTTQPVKLDVQNVNPEIVGFQHGNREHVRTRGGADNSATIEVNGRRAGQFSYVVTLEAQPAAANVKAARDFLQAADRLAVGGEKHRITNVLKNLPRRNPDIRGARNEFAKISVGSATGDLQALIRAAAEALN